MSAHRTTRRAMLAGAASLPTIATGALLSSPATAAADGPLFVLGPAPKPPKSNAAVLARFKHTLEVLRTHVVCDGWKVDEAAAARALRYYQRTDIPCPTDYDEEEFAAMDFVRDHGISADWIEDGNITPMICTTSSVHHTLALPEEASAADPIFAAIERYKKAQSAWLAEQRTLALKAKFLAACEERAQEAPEAAS